MTNDAARNDRLKAALRDNLRRRKAQSRVRGQACVPSDVAEGDASAPEAPPMPGGPAPKPDEG